jgi:hypothetical protein
VATRRFNRSEGLRPRSKTALPKKSGNFSLSSTRMSWSLWGSNRWLLVHTTSGKILHRSGLRGRCPCWTRRRRRFVRTNLHRALPLRSDPSASMPSAGVSSRWRGYAEIHSISERRANDVHELQATVAFSGLSLHINRSRSGWTLCSKLSNNANSRD